MNNGCGKDTSLRGLYAFLISSRKWGDNSSTKKKKVGQIFLALLPGILKGIRACTILFRINATGCPSHFVYLCGGDAGYGNGFTYYHDLPTYLSTPLAFHDNVLVYLPINIYLFLCLFVARCCFLLSVIYCTYISRCQYPHSLFGWVILITLFFSTYRTYLNRGNCKRMFAHTLDGELEQQLLLSSYAVPCVYA